MGRLRYKITIEGIVQGVGFRPYVYRLAKAHKLVGFVLNDEHGVTIEAEGYEDALERFLKELPAKIPEAAKIDKLQQEQILCFNEPDFEIRKSNTTSDDKSVPISPDLPLCADCQKEMNDPENRRYLYPFINCTNCGPRFTIIRDVPYDRPKTTMGSFGMCDKCLAEYENPEDRRFHAQPNACPNCGPSLRLLDQQGAILNEARDAKTVEALLAGTFSAFQEGKILAIKGLGGYHLACDALNQEAVTRLRSRKIREDKPFAVMFKDIEQLEAYAKISAKERELLTSRARPIVLVEKRSGGSSLADSVAPKNRFLGAMIPYTPLHELLCSRFNRPLVMTSANQSDEPITFKDIDAILRLGTIADMYLSHNREIYIRCDDSVVKSFRDGPYFIRRSRGYAPEAIKTMKTFSAEILGVGPHLKNTFCFTRGSDALLSQHIGDLENMISLESLDRGVDHLEGLFNLKPEYIARDTHPEYLSTKWVEDRFGGAKWQDKIIEVQHHHAHIAACLGDNEYDGMVIGIALDGTGHGPDNTVWGGELLLADCRDYLRVGNLRPTLLPGGDGAARHPWRTALSYLQQSVGWNGIEDLAFLKGQPEQSVSVVKQMLDKKLNSPLTTSCGRLFDAVSAIAGICSDTNYEGQAAIELEKALYGVDQTGAEAYDFKVSGGKHVEIDWRPMFKQLVKDVRAGLSQGQISLKFHAGLVDSLVLAAKKLADRYKVSTVALSGGCFLNDYLLAKLCTSLETSGLQVLYHRRVPTNDGGISFGQVVVANSIIEGGKSCVWQFR